VADGFGRVTTGLRADPWLFYLPITDSEEQPMEFARIYHLNDGFHQIVFPFSIRANLRFILRQSRHDKQAMAVFCFNHLVVHNHPSFIREESLLAP